jgi:hypothetical protein
VGGLKEHVYHSNFLSGRLSAEIESIISTIDESVFAAAV